MMKVRLDMDNETKKEIEYFKKRLKELVYNGTANCTQQKFADKVGISIDTVKNYLRDPPSDINFRTAIALTRACRVSLNYLASLPDTNESKDDDSEPEWIFFQSVKRFMASERVCENKEKNNEKKVWVVTDSCYNEMQRSKENNDVVPHNLKNDVEYTYYLPNDIKTSNARVVEFIEYCQSFNEKRENFKLNFVNVPKGFVVMRHTITIYEPTNKEKRRGFKTHTFVDDKSGKEKTGVFRLTDEELGTIINKLTFNHGQEDSDNGYSVVGYTDAEILRKERDDNIEKVWIAWPSIANELYLNEKNDWVVRERLAKGIKYVYFVMEGEKNSEPIKEFLKQSGASETTNLCIVRIPKSSSSIAPISGLTVHFMKDNSEIVYMPFKFNA